MTIKPLHAIIGCLLVLAACTPQAEFVKIRNDMSGLREDTKTTKAQVQALQKQLDRDVQKRLDLLDASSKGTGDVQKSMADAGARADQLATDIQLIQGKLEENNFRIAELSQKLDDKSVKIAELTARIDELEAKVKPSGAGTGPVSTTDTGTGSDRDKKTSPKTMEPTEAYRQAKNDFDKGNFDLALAGFQNFITQYPDIGLTASAQYWIGECYSSKKEFTKAIEAFSKVIKSYPKSDKVAGAKLKIGLNYLNEKNTAKAREYLNSVIKDHPGTTEAQIAKDRLHRIGE